MTSTAQQTGRHGAAFTQTAGTSGRRHTKGGSPMGFLKRYQRRRTRRRRSAAVRPFIRAGFDRTVAYQLAYSLSILELADRSR